MAMDAVKLILQYYKTKPIYNFLREAYMNGFKSV